MADYPQCKRCHGWHDIHVDCPKPTVTRRVTVVANGVDYVVPMVANVVANKRGKDRHRRTPERAKYMRELMRKRRAVRPAAASADRP